MNPARPLSWLYARRPLPRPRLRLLCLPYAGGGATIFHAWPDAMPADVEVQVARLPGRQDRIAEPAPRSVAEIVRELLAGLALLPPAPLVLFGHSFGAVNAFELARSLSAAGTPPRALVVGGRRAPHLPSRTPPIHALPEPAFKDALHQRYGTARALLDDKELMGLVLPSLRADLRSIELYEYVPGPPLAVPLTVLGGRQDASITPEELAAWRQLTTADTAIHVGEGGHFFIDTHRHWVLGRVAELLRGL